MNKKLLKSILCIASGMGIVASIPFATTSCGSSSEKINPLPEKVYKYDETDPTILTGFTDQFIADQDKYHTYNTIEIPTKVTSIADYAFYNTSATTIPSFITNLTFAEGSNCSSIGIRSFESSTLNHTDFSNAISLSLIKSHAFQNCSSLTSIDLSKCTILSSMEFYAFYGCRSLTSVVFSDNLTKIPSEAFANCSKLTSIDLSNCTNLTLIDHSGFDACISLTSVKLPESLEKIEYYGFRGCSSLSSIDFSNVTNLSSIGNDAFEKCSSLTSISLPSNLSTLGYNVFNNCSNLSSITWKSWNGNTGLQTSSFSGVCPTSGTVTVTNPTDDSHNSEALLQYLLDNGGLPSTWAKGVTNPLPEDVYDIQNNVLHGFTSEFLANPSAYSDYNTMEIPANVTMIDQSAFREQKLPSFIKKLTFTEGSKLNIINPCAFKNCSSLTSVDLSNCSYFMELSTEVFNGCGSLRTVKLSNSVNEIDGIAFKQCISLTSITFPSSLTTIGSNVFDSCPNLSSITWDAWNGNTGLQATSFSGVCPTGGTVTVTNPVDGNDSAELLQFLKDKANLPDGWTAA